MKFFISPPFGNYIETNKTQDITIIGGGGITSNEDIVLYKKFGADHISISTLCFNPYQFLKFYFKI